MKVAIFTDSYPPNVDGVATAISLLNFHLKKVGIQTLVITPIDYKNTGVKGFVEKNGVIYFAAAAYPFYKQYKIGIPNPILIAKLKQFDPDVVHIHTPGSSGLLGLFYAKLYDKKVVTTFHTLLSDDAVLKRYLTYPWNRVLSPSHVWRLLKVFYNRADVVVSPSVSIKKELVAHGVWRPIKVISNGIDLSKYIKLKRKKPKGLVILYIGRISAEKRLEVLLQALKLLKDRGVDFTAYFAGEGPDRQGYENWVKENNLANNIKFLGYVKESKKLQLLSSATVFCMPSVFEVQSLSVIEALASGLPVIAAGVPVMKELVKENCGLLFRPNDSKDLANKLIHSDFSKFNPKVCGKVFDIKFTTQRYVEVYQSITQRKV
jgi:glycosyltransferase involved in cell wall biosynthesis